MNPGPVEEVGQTARGIVDALKTQPALLVLSIALIMMILFSYYALHSSATFRDQLIQRVFELQKACIKP